MEWSVVEIPETSGNNVAFASIGRGRIDFNAVACDLVCDNGNYKFAKLLTAQENGKKVVAVKFLENPEENTIPIKRKINNGKTIKGITIVNKGVIGSLFGKDGYNNGTIRRKVELIDKNMLKIID
ncbi:MAG: hypothetical protein IJK26_06215 [Clostridia bacterium]|nr:hypothetical protein [Clostridia bacterium]